MPISLSTKAALLAAILLVGCSKADQLSNAVTATPDSYSGIVNGQEVSAEDPLARSTVALYTEAGGRGSVCTGTLISNTLILTAAHCLGQPGSQVTAIFDLSMDNWNATNSRPIVAAAVNSHFEKLGLLARTAPEQRNKADVTFLQQSGWGDIAILRFGGSLPAGYVPASILPDIRPVVDGGEITLAGYGRTDGAQVAEMRPSPNAAPLGGTGTLRRIQVPVAKTRFKLGEILVDQRGGGACRGDSGGPAYIKDRTGKYWLFGVTSHAEGQNSNNCIVASAVTNVVSYLNWLEKMAPAVMLVDSRKALVAGGKFIPVKVTEADAAQLFARKK